MSATVTPAPAAAPHSPWRKRIIAIVIVLVVALASLVGLFFYFASTSSTVVATKNFSYPEQPAQNPNSTSMSIVNVNGGISMLTWTQASILINGTVTARGLNSAPNNVVLVESNTGGSISFNAQFPNQGGFFNFQNYEVSISIYVPSNLTFNGVKIGTINGGITVQSISATNLGLVTVNGGITFHCGTCANVTATTTNGSVTGSFTSPIVSGNYKFDSVNGSVSITVPTVSSFRLDARTTNGSVTTSGLTLSNITIQTSTHLIATIGTGGATMIVTTINGSVTVTGQ